ncbi:unnamed protein product [Absidia cylindrospora]
MSATAKIPSTKVQKQSLQSERTQATSDAFDGETPSLFDYPIQTQSQAKRNRMKNNTSFISDSFEETTAQDFDIGSTSSLSDLCDDDEVMDLCGEAKERQEQELQQKQNVPWETINTTNSIPSIRKRPVATFYQDWDTSSSKYNKKPKVTANKKNRKLSFRNMTFTKSNNDDSKKYDNSGNPASALIHPSPSEIKTTTMAQQQTDLFSPVSPVPASIANDDDDDDITMLTSTTNNKKEKDVELEVDLCEHDQQLSICLEDDNDDNNESDRSSSDTGEGNSSRVATMNNGDGERNTISPQVVPKEPVDTLSQELPSSMEWHK